MFKNKIALKLSVYFAIALFIFAIIIGSVFMTLFKSQTEKIHKEEMTVRATSIASTISNYLETESSENVSTPEGKGKSQGSMMGNSKSGYGAYLKFIGDIAGTDIWVVDQDLNMITSGYGQGGDLGSYQYTDLPPNAEKLISDVFSDKGVSSEVFSGVLGELTLTVGAPIKNGAGDVIGVVLLHSPIEGVNGAIKEGFTILASSILVALVIAFLISIGFSLTFTKPLKRMKITAKQLVEGKYETKNNIKQKDEIGELARTMDVLADRLEQASQESAKLDQVRKDFVANISHELKTPVTVIRGSLEALIEEIVTDPQKVARYHEQMLKETLFLQRLVGDLLDLSKLQNLDFSMETTEVSLKMVLEEVLRSVEALAQKKGVTFEIELDNSPFIVEGDYGRLRQMLLIVLDNAVKFSKPEGIISVSLKNRVLTIRDQGVGIPKEELPYIFDRFYKSRSEENKSGTGLGLSIAKQIADRHNILLSAESEEGKGSSFIFQI